MKYKVNDRVRISENSIYFELDEDMNPRCEGTIQVINDIPERDLPIEIKWDNNEYNSYSSSDLIKIKSYMYKVNDKLEILANIFSGHGYNVGDIVDVTRIFYSKGQEYYDTCNKKTGDCWTIDPRDVKLYLKYTKAKTSKKMNTFKQAVLDAATKLLKANNTVTTLEIKTELRTTQPDLYSTQEKVSETMDEYAIEGKFEYTDNGTYRTYSYPVPATVGNTKQAIANTVTTSRISRRKALDIIRNNHKGHFFTVEFTKKGKKGTGDLRTMNCQYLSGQQVDPLGVISVKEAAKLKEYNKQVKLGNNPKKDYIRSFDIQTVNTLTLGGQTYKLRD